MLKIHHYNVTDKESYFYIIYIVVTITTLYKTLYIL